MHSDLMQVIMRFRADQDSAIAFLHDRLGIVPPSSNLAWARSLQESGETNARAIFERAKALGMYVRPHGFGIEVALPDVTVDFDWGDRGEGDGFDLSRLWGHCRFNRLFLDVLTESLMTKYFQHAVAKGQLHKDTHLFYLRSQKGDWDSTPAPEW